MTKALAGALVGALLPYLVFAQASANTTPPSNAPAAPSTATGPSPAPATTTSSAATSTSPATTSPAAQSAPEDARSESDATTARSRDDAARAQYDLAQEIERRERLQLRQQIQGLEAEVSALSAELDQARVQSEQLEREVQQLEADRAAKAEQARETGAALQESSREISSAQQQLASGAGSTAELERAQAALSSVDPASPRGANAREASRLIGAALEAMQRDSLYEARVLLQQASAHARGARSGVASGSGTSMGGGGTPTSAPYGAQ
jgi:hypothetical protein